MSDEVLAEIVNERTSRDDCRKGYILDGFPRTLTQVDLLLELAKEQGKQLAVLNLAVRGEILIQRLFDRLICPQCGEIYSQVANPPQRLNHCDRCGAALVHRPDDEPDAVARRLDVYRDQTEPLIRYFRDRGLLMEMDGEQPVEKTFEALVARLERRLPVQPVE